MANKNQQLVDALDINKLKPLYFIHGTEPFYVDQIVDKIQKNAIPEHEKGFNEYVLYGKDITIGDVVNYARKFPMMAERQLILIKEAHLISDIANKESLTLLENYVKKPLGSTLLVMAFGKAQDERKTWVKAFGALGQIFNFKKMYDNEVPDFIIEYCKNHSIQISPKAVQLIAEHIGNNLQAIHNEIEKIRVNLSEGEPIDATTVEKFVGISKDFNVFELQKAVVERNVLKSYKIVKYFGDNVKDHPIQPNVIILYNFFSKVLLIHANKTMQDGELSRLLGVNPYFLRDYKKASSVYPLSQIMKIINTLRIADQKSKGIGTGTATESDLYKDMIYNILH